MQLIPFTQLSNLQLSELSDSSLEALKIEVMNQLENVQNIWENLPEDKKDSDGCYITDNKQLAENEMNDLSEYLKDINELVN